MASYPNQRTVIMPKVGERIRDKDHKYGMFSIDAAKTVAKLGYSTFLLYIIIEKNQDGYEFELSPKALESEWGLKVDAYRSAFKKLVDNGYLIPKREKSNTYYFKEFPIVGKTIEEKIIIDRHIGKNPTSATGKTIEETKNISGKSYDTSMENPKRNNINNTDINNTKDNITTAKQSFAVSAAFGGKNIFKSKKDMMNEEIEEARQSFINQIKEIVGYDDNKYQAFKTTKQYEEIKKSFYKKSREIQDKYR